MLLLQNRYNMNKRAMWRTASNDIELDEFFSENSIFRKEEKTWKHEETYTEDGHHITEIDGERKDGYATHCFSKASLSRKEDTSYCQTSDENDMLRMSTELDNSKNDLLNTGSFRIRFISNEEYVSSEDISVQISEDEVKDAHRYSERKPKVDIIQMLCKKLSGAKQKVRNIVKTEGYTKLVEHPFPLNTSVLKPKYKLLSSFDVDSTNHQAVIGGICPLDDGTCWMYLLGEQEIIRFTWNGEMKEYLRLNKAIDSMTMDDNSNIYVSCPAKKAIIRINKYRQASTLYKLRMFPRGVAYHRQLNKLLVCRNATQTASDTESNLDKNIILCTLENQLSLSTKTAQCKLNCPYRVSVNQQNGDIVISDFSKGVFVLNSELKFRFRVGPHCMPISTVCTDRDGRLLVLDLVRAKCLLNITIFSPDGICEHEMHIQGLNNGSETIQTATVDEYGKLWIALGRTVHVLKILV